jgi:hypothetical protein
MQLSLSYVHQFHSEGRKRVEGGGGGRGSSYEPGEGTQRTGNLGNISSKLHEIILILNDFFCEVLYVRNQNDILDLRFLNRTFGAIYCLHFQGKKQAANTALVLSTF